MSEKYPQTVSEVLKATQQQTGMKWEDIEVVFNDYLKDPFVTQDPQFKTNEERMEYSASLTWTRLTRRGEMKKYSVVPFGFDTVRTTKTKGEKIGAMFALTRIGKEIKPRRIIFMNETTNWFNEINPLNMYEVELGTFGNDLIVDKNQTKFANPKQTKLDVKSILNTMGAKEINTIDAEKYPSKRGSDGYIDNFDWRIVRGIIIRQNIFDHKRNNKPTGTKGGVMTIADRSLMKSGVQMITSPDGIPQLRGFTVWISPLLMVYEDYSECGFAGTISVSKDGGASMTSFLVTPIYAKLKQ